MTAVGFAYVLVITGTWMAFYFSARGVTEQYVNRYAFAQNQLEKNRILALLERELGLARKLADDPTVVAWMLDHDNAARRTNAARQVESYARAFRNGVVFLAFSSNGTYYSDATHTGSLTGTTLSPDNPADRWFFRAIEANYDYAMNVNYDTLLDEVRAWVNVTVRDDNGDSIGLAGVGIDLTAFLAGLVEKQGADQETIIINHVGELQAHRNRGLIEHNARVRNDADKITLFALLPSEPDRAALRAALQSAEAGTLPEPFRVRYENRTMVAALDAIPDLGWFNLVLVDSVSIIGVRSFFPVALVFLVSLGVVFFTVTALLNARVLTPLATLSAAAAAVADGRYDTVLPPFSENEIGALSRSFDAMRFNVRNHTENLTALVAERTRNLTDSIQYGRLIQNAILPSAAERARLLGDHVALLQPLDLVGGDFHFLRPTERGFCVAAVDCTGHGVPGAFMTMMVNALLNRVLELHAEEGPAEMLRRLHHLVQQTLRTGTELAHFENGLDIALCMVDRVQGHLTFVGAGLPLYAVERRHTGERNAVREIGGDRTHLGFSTNRGELHLTEHVLPIEEGKRIYLITDGVLDLPGGERGFGFGRARWIELLESLGTMPMAQQSEAIRVALTRFQGNCTQRDDMTILGFELVPTEERNA